MKKCLYCAEEIQDEAIKCKHCGSMFANKQKEKWYCKTSALVVSFLCVGPLMLPLVWLNKRFSNRTRIIISAVIIGISCFLGIVVYNYLKSISAYYGIVFK